MKTIIKEKIKKLSKAIREAKKNKKEAESSYGKFRRQHEIAGTYYWKDQESSKFSTDFINATSILDSLRRDYFLLQLHYAIFRKKNHLNGIEVKNYQENEYWKKKLEQEAFSLERAYCERTFPEVIETIKKETISSIRTKLNDFTKENL